MSTATIFTTLEDGSVDQSLAVDTTGDFIEAFASSSTYTTEFRAFFFFPTADASTGIPPTATINSLTFTVYVESIFNITGTFDIYACPGCAGTTLTGADFGSVGWTLISKTALNGVGFKTVSIPVALYNRAGYTNVKVQVDDLGDPEDIFFDSFENPSGRLAFLSVNYTAAGLGIPPGVIERGIIVAP